MPLRVFRIFGNPPPLKRIFRESPARRPHLNSFYTASPPPPQCGSFDFYVKTSKLNQVWCLFYGIHRSWAVSAMILMEIILLGEKVLYFYVGLFKGNWSFKNIFLERFSIILFFICCIGLLHLNYVSPSLACHMNV